MLLNKQKVLPKLKWNKSHWGLLFITPWMIGFLVFQLYPLITSLVYSFTDFSILKKPVFIGLTNYMRMFTMDGYFWGSLKATLIYALLSVPSKLIFALFIAMILNMKLKFINFFRTAYYLPSIMGGSVAIAILWRFLFMKEGIINRLLAIVGIPAIEWLSSPNVALVTISLLVVWQFGSSMVLFLAGLKQIPADLYEAGRIDGAGPIRLFFNITIPMLTPIIFFNLIMQSINALQEFTGAFVITNGGPMHATYLIGLKIYDDGFQFLKMGYASALSWVLFGLMMILTIILFNSSHSWVHYEDGGDQE
jgi:oligogalacturonide transport system permease protein